MKRTISELRKHIERARTDQRGRKVFTAGLRDQVVELAHDWLANGRRRPELARQLGLSAATLAIWLQRHGHESNAKPHIMPVRVLDSEPAGPSRAGGCSVLLPSGVRVEGLTMQEVLILARELS